MLKEVVHSYTRKKGRAYCVFIDLSKAFDKVNHFILGETLLNRNVPPDLVLLIMNYLRNQTARVVWGREAGGYHLIDEGVRQGGILSPFLFKLYIDSLVTEISSMEVGCRLGFTRMNILSYADDMVLLADSIENLSLLYSNFVEKVKNLELKINTEKSKCMIFENSRFGLNVEEMELGEDTLENVAEYKYLGHVIQRNLNDEKDIEIRLKQFYGKFNSTLRNFRNVSIETFIHLFCSYCLPEYGLPLWIGREVTRKHIFNVFRVAYSNALKKVVGVPISYSSHDIADYCKLYLFNHYFSIVQCRFFKRILRVNNPLFKVCLPYLKTGLHLPALDAQLQNIYSINFHSNDLNIILARVACL